MDELSIHERMFYHRAVDAVVWAMPLLNFKGFRDAHAAAPGHWACVRRTKGSALTRNRRFHLGCYCSM